MSMHKLNRLREKIVERIAYRTQASKTELLRLSYAVLQRTHSLPSPLFLSSPSSRTCTSVNTSDLKTKLGVYVFTVCQREVSQEDNNNTKNVTSERKVLEFVRPAREKNKKNHLVTSLKKSGSVRNCYGCQGVFLCESKKHRYKRDTHTLL